MFLETCRFPCLCLLLFLAATSVLALHKTNSYSDFLKRHLDNPKQDYQNDKTYCSMMMSLRGLKCQRRNTFIHATEQQLISICNSRGKILQGTQISKTFFPITICKRRRGFRGIACQYKGKSRIRKIRVTCERGFPVHYISSIST